MSDNFRRRTKRTGSTSARFRPSQLVPVETAEPLAIGKTELSACVAVALVAFALIALIWIVTTRAVDEQQAEIRERSEQMMVGQASTIAETIAHELLLIDQSLSILQADWKADSDSVDLVKLQQKMPALTAVTDDLFISDEHHIIRQDILPQAVGQGVGAAYVTFPHGSLEQFQSDGTKPKDSLLLQASIGLPLDARQFLMYVVRPLDHPKGWLIGASYRSTEITKMFAQGALGINPVVALIDTRRGVLQAVVGPAARRPKTDMSKSGLYSAITRAESGTWLGDTAIDGVQRLHAFRHVADRDMAVVVAANWTEVMAPADNLAEGARSLASVATAVVMFIAGIVLWELYTLRGHRRQKRHLDRNKKELERLRAQENTNRSRAVVSASRLQVVLDNSGDGIALFDSGLRLVQWNDAFRRGIGIEPRQDMPLDMMLREQAKAGLFGHVPDIEAEIARRASLLSLGDRDGVIQPGPAHEHSVLRGVMVAEDGFVLLLHSASAWQEPPIPVLDEAAPTSVEW